MATLPRGVAIQQLNIFSALILNYFYGDDIDRIWGSIPHKLTSIDLENFTTVATLNLTTINALEGIAANWTFSYDDTPA